MRTSLVVLVLVLIAAPDLHSLSYAELLQSAQSTDLGLAPLEVAEQQAVVAWKRALLAHQTPQLTLQTGPVQGLVSTQAETAGAASLSAAPSAGVEFPSGPSFRLNAPVTVSSGGVSGDPGLQGEFPLVRGADAFSVAVRQRQLEVDAARAARSERLLQVEKDLVGTLLAVFQADLEYSRSRREWAKAKNELAQAVGVEGAVVGGKAYLEKDRAVRIAERAVLRSQSLKRKHLSSLAIRIGRPVSDELVPSDLPLADLAAALPPPEAFASVVRAQAAQDLAEFRFQEESRTATLALQWGTSYGLGTDSTATSTSGLALRSGVAAKLDDLELSAGLGWSKTQGAGLQLAFTWKPSPAGDRPLRDQFAQQTLTLERLAAANAREEARRVLQTLEARRQELLDNARNLVEDVAWAEAQLKLYTTWRSRGVVTEGEWEDAEASTQSVRDEGSLARLDQRLWEIDCQLLTLSRKES